MLFNFDFSISVVILLIIFVIGGSLLVKTKSIENSYVKFFSLFLLIIFMIMVNISCCLFLDLKFLCWLVIFMNVFFIYGVILIIKNNFPREIFLFFSIYFVILGLPLFIMVIFIALNNLLLDRSFYEILFYLFFEGFAEKIIKIIVILFLCYKNHINILQYFKLNKMRIIIFRVLFPIIFWNINIETIFSYSKILLPRTYLILGDIFTLFAVMCTTYAKDALILMYIEAMFEEVKNSINPPVLPQSDIKTEDIKSDIIEEEKKEETPFYYSRSFIYPAIILSYGFCLTIYTIFRNS